MKFKNKSNGATLALYLSIWLGVVVVGLLLGVNNENVKAIYELSSNPIEGVWNILLTGFKNLASNPIIAGLGGTTAIIVGIIAYKVAGGGFGIMFIVPIVMIFTLLSSFIFPTSTIVGEQIGNETVYLVFENQQSGSGVRLFQIITVVFFGILTILTIYTFIAGRS